MKNIVGILLMCLLFSCTDTYYATKTEAEPEAPEGGYVASGYYHYHYKNYEIEIISDPVGAIIEIDNQYIGKTPTTYTVTGELGNSVIKITKATPTISGQYVQYKYLTNPLPSKIYFNMNLVPK